MKLLLLYCCYIILTVSYTPTKVYGMSPLSCSCDFIITKSGSYSNNTIGIKPGQTVCIQAGTYGGLYFNNFVGTAQKPIRFVNCGGQVVISSDKTPTGIQFYGCQYFVLSGTGEDKYTYGIRVDKTAPGAQAVGVSVKSSDCEIDHIEIAGAGFAGIMVKTDPTCDSTTWRGNLVVRNVKIHHNYIHDTNSEGIYIGSTSWNEGYKMDCGGLTRTVFPHNIYGLEIHHNLTERTGTEGIQYAAAPDAEVHHNIVRNSGLSPFASFQNNGMQLGGGVSGRFYNNQISNTPATGIIIIGNSGNTSVYNNLVVNSGANGIFCDNRVGTPTNTPITFANNTIINSGEEAIKLYNEINTNLICNNIIAKVGAGRRYISFAQGATATATANFMASTVDSVGFVSVQDGDFRLTNTSPLIDAGAEQPGVAVAFDLDNQSRPIGRRIDIGAYEYHPVTDQLLTLYPSPCDDQLFLWATEPIEQVKIYTAAGVEVIRVDSAPVASLNLPIKSLAAGLYVLRAETALGSLSKRFVKR